MQTVTEWAPNCEFKAKGSCCNPDGCHCREIRALQERIVDLEQELKTLREAKRVTGSRKTSA